MGAAVPASLAACAPILLKQDSHPKVAKSATNAGKRSNCSSARVPRQARLRFNKINWPDTRTAAANGLMELPRTIFRNQSPHHILRPRHHRPRSAPSPAIIPAASFDHLVARARSVAGMSKSLLGCLKIDNQRKLKLIGPPAGCRLSPLRMVLHISPSDGNRHCYRLP